jgi:hypothetical protein
MATRAPRTQGIRTYGSGGAASNVGTAKRSAAARKRRANAVSRMAGGVGSLGAASGRGTTRPQRMPPRPGAGTGTVPESGTKSKKLANLRQDRMKRQNAMQNTMQEYRKSLATWKKSKPSSPTKRTAAQRQRIADETKRYAKSRRGNR